MGTLTDCMITQLFSPKLDCYLDADYAGLCSYEFHDNPSSVMSLTGFVVIIRGVSVVWVSCLQSEIDKIISRSLECYLNIDLVGGKELYGQ